ncbi:MAG TPA: PilZ domain-containing protein [Verrucomicrobiae bacterium]|jgi:hypothetical protein|nr:PilZ domain-containing protein [Verrucomicrobiae bacterium]
MGKRREPRKAVEVPVRIFGTDSSGAIFSQKALTVNVSRGGAQLKGVQASLALDEIVGLTYGNNKVHFRVKWIGGPGTARAGHVGLLNITPEKTLWDFPLDAEGADPFTPGTVEKRKYPRYRCQTSIEVHVHNGPSFWGNVADLSIGGCYLEMPIPLPAGTKLKVAIWLGQERAQAEGEVAHCTPGLGLGIRFTQIEEADRGRIQNFLNKLTPFSKKGFVATPPKL